MKDLQGRLVTVAGAGVLGLVTALRLVDAGAKVTVCDPAALAHNASGVAAGMLAPVFESVLDPIGADHLATLTASRDLWPALVARIGLEGALDRSGAVLAGFAGEEASLAAAEARMRALGVAPERVTASQMRGLQPDLAQTVAGGLFTSEDWRLQPGAVLEALAAAITAAGGRIVRARLEAAGEGFRLEGEALEGAAVVATGADVSALASVAPELAALSPIKGQILRLAAGPAAGPVVRGPGGYVSPQPGGVLAGATMEAGRRDLDLDGTVLAGLRAAASRLFPHLADAPATGQAGIRATTPDGLPLIGRSVGPGEVVLCTGARRNGWLLAPLAAEQVARALTGEAALPAFDPRRFG